MLTEIDKIINVGTPQHFFVETIVIYDSPDIFPYVCEMFFDPYRLLFVLEAHPGI